MMIRKTRPTYSSLLVNNLCYALSGRYGRAKSEAQTAREVQFL
jgi:hypothetical protein